ncbi:NAD-dependent epimerase/dehydratase family protein [Chitinophaga sp. Cy-1792]|uniref:NAD-dependent epimerase/dehydratase family protein n=1 Tax=Chitinophaga sp. Cy-1792 TaxID=2608339 RepID=UPI00142489C6|nr:NAD-dependent epimerase/dehydratase family protein [Chitinophaga sp. Cy-1792]NIG54590.1 NAD-dependent epimerase/dehydratase family protein [Chitinophaga sp. Cy-1792]
MSEQNNRILYTILGAGGIIANELTAQLVAAGQRVRLVGRNPKSYAGITDLVAADITDASQTLNAVKGSDVVILCAGLKYDINVWSVAWPAIMNNVIAACKASNAKLLFFDNVYSYGLVEGQMVETSPYNPASRKGEVRAKIATQLMEEVKAGNITATIARAADFYGPHADKTGFLNILIIDKFANKSTAMWIGRDDMPHSYTYTPDAGRAMHLLLQDNNSWNQVWHLPTAAPAPTGKEYVTMIADAMGVKPKYMKLNKFMLSLTGLFDKQTKEIVEMLYQNNHPFVFNSDKFEKYFQMTPTPYQQGIQDTIAAHKK